MRRTSVSISRLATRPSRSFPLGQIVTKTLEYAEDSARRKQDRQHQHQADPELPEGGAEFREIVFKHHVDGGADEGSVKSTRPAEDQHDHYLCGIVEIENGQGDVG